MKKLTFLPLYKIHLSTDCRKQPGVRVRGVGYSSSCENSELGEKLELGHPKECLHG